MSHRHPRLHPAALMAVGALALGTLVLGACAEDAGTDASPDPTTPGPTEPGPSSPDTIAGDGWRGALLDAQLDWLQLEDGTMLDDVTSFAPTEDDARRFEAQVGTALVGADTRSGEEVPEDLDDYVRQYTGVESGSVRHLVVAGLCESYLSDDGWRYSWIEVADGGTCFWDATMDLGSGEIIRFSFHGSA
jgi:hypothetical protein